MLRRYSAAAFVTALALLGFSHPQPIAAASPVKGFDVSHWQGRVDYATAYRAGFRFVIAKATEGKTYIDPRYSQNRVAAAKTKLRFTAYHFAQPDRSHKDAVREADHFVRAARLHSGNLRPVLDLERYGGLSRSEMVRWTKSFVLRVYHAVGVKPIIYVSPSFWGTRLGNPTWFAHHGFRLWIAHHDVSRPSIPAANWAGHSWTIWQQGVGRVPGIAGRVDRNVLHGTALSRLTIR